MFLRWSEWTHSFRYSKIMFVTSSQPLIQEITLELVPGCPISNSRPNLAVPSYTPSSRKVAPWLLANEPATNDRDMGSIEKTWPKIKNWSYFRLSGTGYLTWTRWFSNLFLLVRRLRPHSMRYMKYTRLVEKSSVLSGWVRSSRFVVDW